MSVEAYRTVMLDPPWDLGGSRGGPGNHYRLMKTDAIIELVLATEVFGRVGRDAHCWLWVVGNLLPDGLRVMEALGFRYVTNLCWVKHRMGIGVYLRTQHELCLFGVRGRTMTPPSSVAVPSVAFVKRTAHSRKPTLVYKQIERVSPGPYLSMFEREIRPGWDVWGNEAPSYGNRALS